MNKRLILILAAIVFIATAGCNSGSGSSSLGSGDLSVSLTDAATPEYKAVYISVSQAEVKASSDDNDNGWQMVDVVDKTINLLELTGGILEPLGTRNLPAQTYNQIRLVLASAPDDEKNLNGDDHPFANYVIETDDTVHELKVPSGYQSGIKLVKQFTISASGLTELILDFDAMKSVVQAGNSGNWILKPVIEVLDTVTIAGINGSVTDSPPPGTALQDTYVSAQVYNSIASDEKDRVTIQAGTLTTVDGSYRLGVPEGEYRIVVYKGDFRPQCRIVTATTGETLTADFALVPSVSGTLTVRVTGLAQTDDSITLSIRRTALCTDGSTIAKPYEVTSRAYTQEFFADGGDAVFNLPARNSSAGYTGDYTVMVYGDSIRTRYQTETVTSTPTIITFSY